MNATGSARQPDIERAIALFLDRLQKAYAIEKVLLYGSYARGDFTADSDVDLAVVLQGERGNIWNTAQAFGDITYDVLMETGVALSALPVWNEDLDFPDRARNPALMLNIHREGIPV